MRFEGLEIITVNTNYGTALKEVICAYYKFSYYFYLNVGDNTQRQLAVYFNDESDTEKSPKIELANPVLVEGGKLLPNQWQRIRIPLADIGASQTTIVRVNIQDNSGSGQKDFYVDGIRLIGALPH